MNPRRAEKLSMDELMLIWRMSRDAGIHILAGFIGQEMGYRIEPITKEEKQAHLVERWEIMRREMSALMKQIEGLK